MPAARPVYDALAVWIIVQVDGGEQDAAFVDIESRMKEHLLRRGVGPLIDIDKGGIVGDKLSASRLKKLYQKGQQLVGPTPSLRPKCFLRSKR